MKVVYGARCSWWDTIDQAAGHPQGLPCCPFCGGSLYEVESEEQWAIDTAKHDAENEPGHSIFVAWLRGKCRPTVDDARSEFARLGGEL